MCYILGSRLLPGMGIPFSKIPCKFLPSAKYSQNTLEKSEDVFASSNYHSFSLCLSRYLVQIAIWPERERICPFTRLIPCRPGRSQLAWMVCHVTCFDLMQARQSVIGMDGYLSTDILMLKGTTPMVTQSSEAGHENMCTLWFVKTKVGKWKPEKKNSVLHVTT